MIRDLNSDKYSEIITTRIYSFSVENRFASKRVFFDGKLASAINRRKKSLHRWFRKTVSKSPTIRPNGRNRPKKKSRSFAAV